MFLRFSQRLFNWITVAAFASTLGVGTVQAKDEKSSKDKDEKSSSSKKEKKDKKKKDKDKVEDSSEMGMAGFAKFLALNQKSLQVRIPSFERGWKSTLITANSMERINDDDIEFDDMNIYMYSETPGEDVTVDMITSIYRSPLRVLISDKHSTVTRQDFTLEGDSLIFDTRTQQGEFKGNVKMVIHNAGDFGATAPKAPVPAPAPNATPQAQ